MKDIGAIKALLAYSLAQGWVEANVAAGVSVAKGTVKGKSDRSSYETDEARAILDAAAKLPVDGPRGGADHHLPMPRLNSTRTTDHASAFQRVWSISAGRGQARVEWRVLLLRPSAARGHPEGACSRRRLGRATKATSRSQRSRQSRGRRCRV